MTQQQIFLYGTIITIGTLYGLTKYWQANQKKQNNTKTHYENWGN